MNDRCTMVIPGHLGVWRHETAILPDYRITEQLFPTEPPPVARCISRRPATRCDCGMFDLMWERRIKETP